MTRVDRLLLTFWGTRPFVCLRCGWRGRKLWTDEQLVESGADETVGASDPALTVLDSTESSTRSIEIDAREVFVFPHLDGDVPPDSSDSPAAEISVVKEVRSRRRFRRRNSLGSEVVATIAISVVALLIVAIVVATGSCRGGIDEL